MGLSISPAFEVKNLLGRGKAYLNKKEIIKGIMAICEAMKLFMKSNIHGKERIEIEILMGEVAQIISTIPEIKEYLPANFGYSKGGEKKFLLDLVGIIKKIAKEIEEGRNKEEEKKSKEQKKKELFDILQEYLMKKDYMDAATVIKKIFSEYGADPAVIVDVAKRFYSSGNYDKTIHFCKQALNKNPKDMNALRLLINAYRCKKDYESAEKCYKKALEFFGEHGNIYFNLSKLYKEWDKGEEAREAIQKAIKLEPDNKEYKELAQKIL